MRATVESATLHFTCESLIRLPWASRRVAKNPALSRTVTVSSGGVMVADATGPGFPGRDEPPHEAAGHGGGGGRGGPGSLVGGAGAVAAAAEKLRGHWR